MRFLAFVATVMGVVLFIIGLHQLSQPSSVTEFHEKVDALVHTAVDRGYDCAVQGLTREQCHSNIDACLHKPE